MPLYPQEKCGIFRHFHTFDQVMGRMARSSKAWRKTADSLMVHTVDLDGMVLRNLSQEGTWSNSDSMGRNFIGKRLHMSNREILCKLAGKILVDIAAKADIKNLDTAADA